MVGWDRAESTPLVVLHGLNDLLTRIHDEGPVADDRLADRKAAEDKNVEGRGITGLRLGCLGYQMITRTENSDSCSAMGRRSGPTKP